MWSRTNLKERAKSRFRTNYWKTVLVALILISIGGGVGSSIGSNVYDDNNRSSFEQDINHWDSGEDESYYAEDAFFTSPFEAAIGLGIIIVIAIVIVVLVCAIVIPLQILILNPLEIGCKRFFAKNLYEDAQVKEICYAFDYGYKGNVKTMFFRDLYTFLWSLLFIIPGIIKSYEYRMIPYILGENPGMDTNTAFALSKRMMTGNKWNAFVLDLSFIGWHILDSLTLGILGIFYVNPYVHQTDAALYDALKAQVIPQNF